LDHGQEWVSGIVAKNPFTANRMKRLAASFDEFFQQHLTEPKYLLCAVDDWYPNRDEVSKFSVRSVYGTWIGHVPVLNVHRSWEDHVRRSQDTSVNESLLAEVPNLIGAEDGSVNRAVEALFDRLSHDSPNSVKKEKQ
jgi:hypothetical protein